MASAASVELAAAVSNAGGLGSLGLSYHKIENILPDYNKVINKTNQSINLNFMTHKEPRKNDIKAQKYMNEVKKYYVEYNIPNIPSLVNTTETFNEEHLELVLKMNPKVVRFILDYQKTNILNLLKI